VLPVLVTYNELEVGFESVLGCLGTSLIQERLCTFLSAADITGALELPFPGWGEDSGRALCGVEQGGVYSIYYKVLYSLPEGGLCV